jgi:hypothetical protein
MEKMRENRLRWFGHNDEMRGNKCSESGYENSC